MAIVEIFLWVATIMIISAIAFLAWLAMMMLSVEAKATIQQDTTKNKVESREEIKPEPPSETERLVESFFKKKWLLITSASFVLILFVASVFFVKVIAV